MWDTKTIGYKYGKKRDRIVYEGTETLSCDSLSDTDQFLIAYSFTSETVQKHRSRIELANSSLTKSTNITNVKRIFTNPKKPAIIIGLMLTIALIISLLYKDADVFIIAVSLSLPLAMLLRPLDFMKLIIGYKETSSNLIADKNSPAHFYDSDEKFSIPFDNLTIEQLQDVVDELDRFRSEGNVEEYMKIVKNVLKIREDEYQRREIENKRAQLEQQKIDVERKKSNPLLNAQLYYESGHALQKSLEEISQTVPLNENILASLNKVLDALAEYTDLPIYNKIAKDNCVNELENAVKMIRNSTAKGVELSDTEVNDFEKLMTTSEQILTQVKNSIQQQRGDSFKVSEMFLKSKYPVNS